MTGDSKKPGDGLMPIGRRSLLALMAGTAGVSLSEFTQAIGGSDGLGAIFAGTAALSQSYNVAGDLYVGPDSTKSSVAANSGRMFFATDTQEVFYGDSGTWTSLGTIGGGGGALSDSGTNNADGGDEYTLPAAEDSIDLLGTGDISDAATIVQGGSSSNADELTSRKHNGVINLEKWRDDNGFGDIGAAFNDAAAWLTANTNGGVLYLPQGSYSIDTRIVWGPSNSIDSRIRWIGAGGGETGEGTELTTSLATGNVIEIENMGTALYPEIGHMRWDMRGLNADEVWLYTNNNFTYLHNINGVGNMGENQVAYQQERFWFREYNCDFSNSKAVWGLASQQAGSQGVHISCHYRNNNGDYGVESRGGPAGHIVHQCKIIGGTNSMNMTGDGGNVILGLDQESTGGQADFSSSFGQVPNFHMNYLNQGLTPGRRDRVVNVQSVNQMPIRGSIDPLEVNVSGWPSGDGPAVPQKLADHQYLRLIYDGRWRSITQQWHDDFMSGAPPDPWTDQSSGGSISRNDNPGGGITLSTGGSTNNTAAIDFGDNHPVKLNRLGLAYFRFTHADTTNVRIRLGLRDSANNNDNGIQFSTASGTSATNWVSYDNGTETDLSVTASSGTLTEAFMTYYTGESSIGGNDEISPQVITGGKGGSNGNDFMQVVAQNDWQPFFEIETLADADKTLDVEEFGFAQRMTADAGP